MNNEINTQALFHAGSVEYISPLEPDINEDVTLYFRVLKNNVDKVNIIIEDIMYPMEKAREDDIFTFYKKIYHCTEKQIRYCFLVSNKEEQYYYDQTGVRNDNVKEFHFLLSPGFKTPDWAKGAVMYQIYVDRFCNGDKTNDVLTNEYYYIGEGVKRIQDWSSYPEEMDVRNFYGGDLQGVLDKLDYLYKLGIEVIYFNPVFVSPSNHKYDIQDYDYIDPHFSKIVDDGGEVLKYGDVANKRAAKYIRRVANLKNLEASNDFFAYVVKKIHEKGMKVILDGVFNHCGSFNKWLDREKIYQGQEGFYDGAYIKKESKYNSFFDFVKDAWPDNKSYDGWWGHSTLPKLNYEGSKELYDYIMHIARKWVMPPYNVDGWRLDVAADLGHSEEFNHKFWRDFRDNVKKANPNAIIIAEHYGNPRGWLAGDQWDTVMNYDAFMEPISWFLTGMEKHSDVKQEALIGNADVFENSMKISSSHLMPQSLLVAMNELSNHDHSRFLTRTNGIVGRTSTVGAKAANEGINKAVLKEAVIMQMTWPGAATLYYGEEAGVCGWTDPDNRRTFPWGHEDVELIEFYREAICLRKSNKALRIGSFKYLYKDYNILVYSRMLDDNIVIVIINNNQTEKTIPVPVWQAGGTDNMKLEKLIETNKEFYNVGRLKYDIINGVSNITVKGQSAWVLRVL